MISLLKRGGTSQEPKGMAMCAKVKTAKSPRELWIKYSLLKQEREFGIYHIEKWWIICQVVYGFVAVMNVILSSQLPLWVCLECRKKVEEDERRAGMDTALVVSW